MLYNKNWQKPTTWQEVLLQAADLIEKDGWCRGSYEKGKSHCMLGAIQVVCGDDTFQTLLTREATSALFDSLGGSVIMFNDFKARSGKQVAAKMRAVANG